MHTNKNMLKNIDICTNILKETEEGVDDSRLMKELQLEIQFLNYLEEQIECNKNSLNFDFVILGISNEVFDKNYREFFLRMLSAYNYDLKTEIISSIKLLLNSIYSNETTETIRTCLKSPVIQDVIYDGKGNFKIYSKKYGVFEIHTILSYFEQNSELSKYIEERQKPADCHNDTYFLSTLFPDCYSITSLVEDSFNKHYYHSYTFNPKDNNIIDLRYRIVMPKDQYYKLFEPKELSVVENKDILKQHHLVVSKTIQPSNRCILLKIALYKEYLKRIGYEGPIESAPSIQKIKLKKLTN